MTRMMLSISYRALCILEVAISTEVECAVQFDDPKDTSKDPKVVNMNIRKRVMKGAAQEISRCHVGLLAVVHHHHQAFSVLHTNLGTFSIHNCMTGLHGRLWG